MARTSRPRSVLTRGEDFLRLEDFWDEPAPIAPVAAPVRATAEALQGAWLSVSGRRQVEMLFSGSHYTVHFADGDIYMGSFTVSPVPGPGGIRAALDMHIDEGPQRHKGLVARALFEVDGDTLRWCTAPPGNPERPTDFAEPTPKYLCLVLRREHSADKL